MAASNLFVLIDDIATLLDDVSLMTKVAAKKTAGVLGDDLALNAQQVTGVTADRELPVVWAVTKGSLRNKLILVPAALLISYIAPWLITPLLMLGGAFLCYEGVEKLAHAIFHSKAEKDAHHEELRQAVTDETVDLVSYEKDKIKGAIRTDFILSAEIIVITLGTVATAPISSQIMVVSIVALAMTLVVYGLVAAIVKMDDAGLYLALREGAGALKSVSRAVGRFLLAAAPKLMKTLSVVGTAAMFLVGGGILLHGIPASHDILHHLETAVAAMPGVGHVFEWFTAPAVNGLFGVVAGAVVLGLVSGVMKVKGVFGGESA